MRDHSTTLKVSPTGWGGGRPGPPSVTLSPQQVDVTTLNVSKHLEDFVHSDGLTHGLLCGQLIPKCVQLLRRNRCIVPAVSGVMRYDNALSMTLTWKMAALDDSGGDLDLGHDLVGLPDCRSRVSEEGEEVMERSTSKLRSAQQGSGLCPLFRRCSPPRQNSVFVPGLREPQNSSVAVRYGDLVLSLVPCSSCLGLPSLERWQWRQRRRECRWCCSSPTSASPPSASLSASSTLFLLLLLLSLPVGGHSQACHIKQTDETAFFRRVPENAPIGEEIFVVSAAPRERVELVAVGNATDAAVH
ncbi:unnamed protein product [Cyprideis torosa]|uniref:Uncharacterized protein n=1 Tax=Cyprideis torosa TaxID=163714 RepID=A0A7R8WFH1_9CRUS|nr:unnamed protein product [Cyprideis torosa]CAG0894131.1 unnamed protein product [Cyprideis torosa]